MNIRRRRYSLRIILPVTAIAALAAFSFTGCSDKKTSPNGPSTITVIYDNGAFVTHPGTGYNGADVSALHDGFSTLGFTCDSSLGYKLADDFTVPAGQSWYIDEMTFYPYQSGVTDTMSTITGLYVQIWSGYPDSAGSTVVWGSPDFNVLKSSVWSGCYRTNAGDTATAYTRPIMSTTCDVKQPFQAGTYWVEFAAEGSMASGPYAVPIDTLGVLVTGNGIQYNPNDSTWSAVHDGSSLTAMQGFPFRITGYIQ